jgi:hypothetical protein
VVGTSGQLKREERRETEAEYGAQTRSRIIAAGEWPKNLPLYSENSCPHNEYVLRQLLIKEQING